MRVFLSRIAVAALLLIPAVSSLSQNTNPSTTIRQAQKTSRKRLTRREKAVDVSTYQYACCASYSNSAGESLLSSSLTKTHAKFFTVTSWGLLYYHVPPEDLMRIIAYLMPRLSANHQRLAILGSQLILEPYIDDVDPSLGLELPKELKSRPTATRQSGCPHVYASFKQPLY